MFKKKVPFSVGRRTTYSAQSCVVPLIGSMPVKSDLLQMFEK